MNPANNRIPVNERSTSLIRWGYCLILEALDVGVSGDVLGFTLEKMPEYQDEGKQQQQPARSQAKTASRHNCCAGK